MYAITGITGNVGRAAGNALIKQNLPVKAVVRNPAKGIEWQEKGAIVALAEFHDAFALEKAFSGANGIFIMTPPLFDSEDPLKDHDLMLQALCAALIKAQPKKIVYLSSIGAQHSNGTGAIRKLYDMEKAFNQLSIPTVSIRAAWFMENFSGFIASAKESGKLQSFLNPTDMAIPMIASRDIGSLVAGLLIQEWSGHRIIELEGPCRYSVDDVALIMTYQLQRDVHASAISENEFANTYQSFGFTKSASLLMAEMNVGFNNKHIIFEDAGTEHVFGNTLLEDALRSELMG